MKKKHCKKHKSHHVIAKVHPKVVAAIVKNPHIVKNEPHVIVGVPQTIWQRASKGFSKWLEGGL